MKSPHREIALVVITVLVGVVANDSIPTDTPASVRRVLLKRQAKEKAEQESRVIDTCEGKDKPGEDVESTTPPTAIPMAIENNEKINSIPLSSRQSLDFEMPSRLSKLYYDIGEGPEIALVYKQDPSADIDSKCFVKQDEPTESRPLKKAPDDNEDSTQCSELPNNPHDSSTTEDTHTCHPQPRSKVASSSSPHMCKFFNLSNRTLHLIWKHGESFQDLVLIKKMKPLTTHGTSCRSNHIFLFLDIKKPERSLIEFEIGPSQQRLYVYEDNSIPSSSLAGLDHDRHTFPREDNHFLESVSARYEAYLRTLKYAKLYEDATGNPFLSNYGRGPPSHFQYSCDRVGKEFHLRGGQVLRVVSTSPCALEVENLLDEDECDAIRVLAQRQGLHESETISAKLDTRSSFNTWIQPSSPSFHNADEAELQKKVDRIFSKAAETLRIPYDIFLNVTEPFQVVSYTVGQEYQGHFDFSFPPSDYPQQPTRFATMLFYLNGGDETHESKKDAVLGLGGETEFPLAKPCPIKVAPKTGKAVLFYSQLPDGNMDERSLHAALPVIEGTKWLANL